MQQFLPRQQQPDRRLGRPAPWRRDLAELSGQALRPVDEGGVQSARARCGADARARASLNGVAQAAPCTPLNVICAREQKTNTAWTLREHKTLELMIEIRQNAELDFSTINNILRMIRWMLISYIAVHAVLLALIVLYVVLCVAFCAFTHDYQCGTF